MRLTSIAIAAALLIPGGTLAIADQSPAAAGSKAGVTELSAAKKAAKPKAKKKPAQEQFMRAAPSR